MPLDYSKYGFSNPYGAYSNQQLSPIQGQLPFGSEAANVPIGADNPAVLGQSYAKAYNDALAMNRQNYGNILAGYQSTLAQQQAAQQQVQKGYSDLYDSVLKGIEGMGESRRNEIQDQYQAAGGASLQNLINAGLGNTTVTSSVARGVEADRAKALTNLNDQLSGLKASYSSSLGQAGLGYAASSAAANAGLMRDQLNWMNSVNAAYPSASLYSQLAQMAGAAQEGERNRQALAGGVAQPSMGLSRLPSSGGMLRSPNSDMFSPSYDIGGNAGYGSPWMGAWTQGYNPATAYGSTLDVAGYGKDFDGGLTASYGPSSHTAYDYTSGYGSAGAATGYGEIQPSSGYGYGIGTAQLQAEYPTQDTSWFGF